MSEETFIRARGEAGRIAAAGHAHDIAVVSIRLITNGWGQDSARCAEVQSHAVEFSREAGHQGMVIWADWKDAHRAVYVIDDGVTAQPMYVSGWHQDLNGRIYLESFPMNVHPDGTPRLRHGDHRPVDFSSWMLEARRAFHVKVTREIPALAGQPY